MTLTAEQQLRLEAIKITLKQKQKPKFSIENFCFDKQIAFIRDPSRFKTAVCSRRAGKTTACAAHLISAALENQKRVCFYITLSRLNAKKIIWPEVLEINRGYELRGIVNESDLSITFPNKSVIYFSGANDRTQIENFRGFAITLAYLDECQSFPYYIENLIEDVISKALFDYNGTLCLIGTPGPVPAGYFYGCATSKDWSHHDWTMFDNPWLATKSGKSHAQILADELIRKGVPVTDPTIQRECFGKWVVDPKALVFKYEQATNDFDDMPIAQQWVYIIGVDIGFEDADAICVIGYNERSDKCYLVEEVINRKQGITELADQIELLIEKYDPLKVVMDTGGLGKKIAGEITKRRQLPIQAADKTRKNENIELLNDAMRTGKFMAKKHSQFATECGLVEWDKDKSNADKLVISDRFHSDIIDAVLYAARECYSWMFQEAPKMPTVGTEAWFSMETDKIEQMLIDNLNKNKEHLDGWADEF